MINFVDDEQVEKLGEQLEKLGYTELGYTKENFKGSRLEILLKSMFSSIEEIIQEETLKLMKGNGLSYGEARIVVIGNILNSIK